MTAGDKTTGIAVLNGLEVETCSLFSDDEILDYIEQHKPKIVSIDSPLGLPGGGDSIDPKAGIVRVAEARSGERGHSRIPRAHWFDAEFDATGHPPSAGD